MSRLDVRSLIPHSRRRESDEAKSRAFLNASSTENLPRPGTATGGREPAKHRSIFSRLFSSRQTHAKRPRQVTDLSSTPPAPNDSQQTVATSPLSTGKAGLPEIEPILGFLANQANRLYHAGYLLKLNDLETHGQPCEKRDWIEYYAQLTGTVLVLWEADALDKVSGNKEFVVPSMMNIADASMKMIERLDAPNSRPLANTLSVSTAAQNRFLFHFKDHESLLQWTAAIRLAIFENTLLQESYTGSLFAGKGKTINNLSEFLRPTRFVHESWTRVRFRPGTPWRRCWCVITPADEKGHARQQKTARKATSAYERATPLPLVPGDVSFYEAPEKKGTVPLARITQAWAAFAVYPQSFEHIQHSTLLKVEGMIHVSTPDTARKGKVDIVSCEGSVFVLPEPRPQIAGFEVMLRWLLPVFDTFGLYGRPRRLLADTDNWKSFMFALPLNKLEAVLALGPDEHPENHSFGTTNSAKRSAKGYLTVPDIVGLIKSPGSENWDERTFRQKTKELISNKNDGPQDRPGTGNSQAVVEESNGLGLLPFGGSRPGSCDRDNSKIHPSPAPQISPIRLTTILGSPSLEEDAFPGTPSKQYVTSKGVQGYAALTGEKSTPRSKTAIRDSGIQSMLSQSPWISYAGSPTSSDISDLEPSFESPLPPIAPLAAISAPPEICRAVTNPDTDTPEGCSLRVLNSRRLSATTMSLIEANAKQNANINNATQGASTPCEALSPAMTTWGPSDSPRSASSPHCDRYQNQTSQSAMHSRGSEGGLGVSPGFLVASPANESVSRSVSQSRSFRELLKNMEEETNNHTCTTSPDEPKGMGIFDNAPAIAGSEQPSEPNIRIKIPQVLENPSADMVANRDSGSYFLGSPQKKPSRARSLNNLSRENSSSFPARTSTQRGNVKAIGLGGFQTFKK